ncbi:MAG: TrmH family RNA methyltransferase [Pirellulaceae bacterium]
MHPTITSLQNQRVKDAARLRERRGRKIQDRIIIDGAREVLRALEADVELSELFVCEELSCRPEASRAIELSQERGIELLRATPEVFGKLSFGERAEGVVAVAKTPQCSWPENKLPDESVVVVLEHVEKPGNLGGVVRTADAAGVKAVFVADTKVDLYSPNAIRASLGTIFSQPVISAAGTDILRRLREQGVAMFAARVDGAVDYSKADYTGRVALVLGSEAQGLSPLWRAPDITSVALPMLGRADSLNVSVTAAVLVYEALRQKRK